MHAVGKALNIKPGAAGTRFYRLRQRMDAESGGQASTPTTGGKRNAEESGVDGEEGEEESPQKKKATAKGKGSGNGKGKKAGGAGEAKVKEEATSDNEMANGESAEGGGSVFN